ncbi:MAG: nicotinate phosphoribosyltransferase [Alphaproteobacteria bacterium 43-37]|mgnify:CR=1 FL=1|nr:MAG: nicotinate phosphoribosyltransferase [Alphaproteobacteria bacterium 43-37]
MSFRNNLILDTDSYKSSHWLQYPPGTEGLYAYFESRGGQYPGVVFFGLQYYLQEYLSRRITEKMVEEAASFFKKHGMPFNHRGWLHIARDLGGYIPVHIKSVPEGTYVPNGNILFSVESTSSEAFWIVTWLETLIARVWYPITVATKSYFIRKKIMGLLDKTTDNPEDEIEFKLHDFGARGTSSQESAGIGGAAHLVSFCGSDNVFGVNFANHYYNDEMAGFSIPAAEHSTITSWGREHEALAFKNVLDHFAKPGAIVAVVSDSYNIWDAIDNIWGDALKEQVIKSGATIVIRPDSGDPTSVVLAVLRELERYFGSQLNSKGYKVLNYVRVIQGDGINESVIDKIINHVSDAGYSLTNVNFGMGGALLQQLNRDTQKMAYKCSLIIINQKPQPIFKDPVTDPTKKSKAGKLSLVRHAGFYQTIHEEELCGREDLLVPVFSNGEILKTHSLYDIRQRLHGHNDV